MCKIIRVLAEAEINLKGLSYSNGCVSDIEARSAFAKEPRLEEVLKAILAAGVPCKGLIRGGYLAGVQILG